MSSIWETLEFEEIIEAALIRDLNETHGKIRFGYYTTAREYLLVNVLEEIKRAQPNMSDHGPKHIKNVLQNIQELLGSSLGEWDRTKKTLSGGELNGMELYILGLSALFHDVGNVFTRKEHQLKIGPIYDAARPPKGTNKEAHEKVTILNICKAHCGDGFDGSKNTLAFVDEHAKLEHFAIRPNMLAPILRFADELAEGPQRTSHYMVNKHKYPKSSVLFHQYALSKSVDIDRAHNRIRLQYHINLQLPGDTGDSGLLSHGPTISIDELAKFLKFSYQRIEKVNQERQYAKHYCNLLEPFKETSAVFNFWYKRRLIPVDLTPVQFTDLVVPGDLQKSLIQRDNHYKPDLLISNLTSAIGSMAI